MKRLITFILFLGIVYTSNSQSFGRMDWCKARQEWSTWCGHATVEMLSCGMVLQEESATFHGIFHLDGSFHLNCFNASYDPFFKYCVIDAGVTPWELLDILAYYNGEKHFAEERFHVVATFDQIFGTSRSSITINMNLPTALCIVSLKHAVLLLGFDRVILNGEYVIKLRVINPATGAIQYMERNVGDTSDLLVVAAIN
ncbi:MAG: hypothetical protein KHW86_02470 [Porphyromonadaceae bacterium]|uniref:hypothetical protein n=1 Tax=uncultured Butyricimonas sp. TaxID=1268785 RepID=UPI002592A0C0|nr:hypothetical protein [uncultured Butyricimonas sp.]MBS5624066.1 hypothetical protein [Porphyromonadaceae bacterium]